MRRLALPALLALVPPHAAPARPAKLPVVNVGPIRWPGPQGRLLHGVMAIPAKARGRQPAVLVLGEGSGAGGTARRIAERLAAAGLLACAFDGQGGASAIEEARTTVAWLATNRYATGKVGLLAFGGGLGAARALAGEGKLAAIVYAGDGAPPAAGAVAIRALDPAMLADPAPPSPDFAAAAAFLEEHLR